MSSGHFLSSLEPRFSSLTVWCHACMLSLFSRVQLFVMPWTAIRQAPLSMGFSRQEYWIGLPCSPPGVLLDPGIKPESLMSPALADRFFTPRATWGTTCCVLCLVTQSCPTLCDPVDSSPPGSSVHGVSPGKNTGVGRRALLHGIFPTQGSNPGLPHCGQILYHLT